jgi:hypothetical protein
MSFSVILSYQNHSWGYLERNCLAVPDDICELFSSDVKGFTGSLAGTLNWGLAFFVTVSYPPLSKSIGISVCFLIFTRLRIASTFFSTSSFQKRKESPWKRFKKCSVRNEVTPRTSQTFKIDVQSPIWSNKMFDLLTHQRFILFEMIQKNFFAGDYWSRTVFDLIIIMIQVRLTSANRLSRMWVIPLGNSRVYHG